MVIGMVIQQVLEQIMVIVMVVAMASVMVIEISKEYFDDLLLLLQEQIYFIKVEESVEPIFSYVQVGEVLFFIFKSPTF